jgi:hypothetical protein
MKAGREPLRTFGDLKQFWQIAHRKPPDEEPQQEQTPNDE